MQGKKLVFRSQEAIQSYSKETDKDLQDYTVNSGLSSNSQEGNSQQSWLRKQPIFTPRVSMKFP